MFKRAHGVSSGSESRAGTAGGESSLLKEYFERQDSAKLSERANPLSVNNESVLALERRIGSEARNAGLDSASDQICQVKSKNTDGTYELLLTNGATLSAVPNIATYDWPDDAWVTIVFVSGAPQITAMAVQKAG